MKFNIFFVFAICFFIIHTSESEDNLSVEYYETIINETIQEEFQYQLPTNSQSYLRNSTDNEIEDYGTFDFIIVGAGTAGTVIANRLTENRHWTVLILEAGKNETEFSDIPTLGTNLRFSEMDWGYRTTPQNYACLGLIEGRCPVLSGKVLGGTTVENDMVYARGNRHDFDNWQNAGNRNWSYANILPYFRKSENSEINGDPGYHGIGGPLNVDVGNRNSPILQTFIDANEELHKKVVDYNGRRQVGVSKPQYNVINGRRDSGNKAFLIPAQNRPTISIVTQALVLQILINPQTKETFGVQFILNGKFYEAYIRKEVILSAGVINSPQLLMLSGVGPRSNLNQNGIKVINNLPGVGKNLQDHVWFSGLTFEVNYTEPIRSLRQFVKDYLNGVFVPLFQGVSFIQHNFQFCDYPDLELLFTPPNGFALNSPDMFNFTQETVENYFGLINARTTFSIYVLLMHPKSSGTVQLSSGNPFDYPIIDLNFYSDFRDLEMMYKGIHDTLRLVDTKAFQRYNATLLNYQLPACANFTYLSRDYWYCTLQQLSFPTFHEVGTCKMGPSSDVNAVVDDTLKVHGIKYLRVADASVMPQNVAGHTCAATYMIGEKVSDLIKLTYA